MLQPLRPCLGCPPMYSTGIIPQLLVSLNHLHTKTYKNRSRFWKYRNSTLTMPFFFGFFSVSLLHFLNLFHHCQTTFPPETPWNFLRLTFPHLRLTPLLPTTLLDTAHCTVSYHYCLTSLLFSSLLFLLLLLLLLLLLPYPLPLALLHWQYLWLSLLTRVRICLCSGPVQHIYV